MAITNDRIFLRAIMTGDYSIVKTAVQEIEDRPGLYCIFNSETGMLYIGCSNNARTRIVTHKRQMANGDHLCRQMSADYIKNSDAFVFFVLEYVDFDLYTSLEMHRTVLLNRETQYMKRVPHLKLYNNSVPVSMSEKLLMSEIPAERIKINVSDIFRRLEMSPDSIRANGYSIQDELTLPDAIEFVRKRTVANGRWPQEKADLAVTYLHELEAMIKPDSESVSDLIAGSRFDYFGDYVVKTPMPPGRAKIKWPTLHEVRRFLISALLFVVVILHGALIWYDCGALWGVPGAIGGGAVFAIVFAALLLASDATLPRTSGNALAFMFFVDCAAWKVHYEVFKTPLVENYITASLCAFICASSFVALWLFRDSKLD